MKLPVLFVPLLTLTLGVQAQPAYKYSTPAKQYSPYVLEALTRHLSTAQKTTAAHERLIGYSVYVFDGTGMSLQDSTNFHYSNARGSEFNPNNMFLDDENILFDSATYYFGGSSGLEFDRAHKSTYDNANKLLSRLELRKNTTSQPENFRDRRSFYNTNGNLATAYVLAWNTSSNSWDTLTRRNYTYDSQNRHIADSIYSYAAGDFTLKTEYSLDGNGNRMEVAIHQRQGSNWVPQYLEKNSYDALNNITTTFSQVYDLANSAFRNNSFDTFAYNNNHVYHFTESQLWNTTTNSWEFNSRELRTLNAAGDRVMMQDMKDWDAQTSTWQDEAVIEWTYNAMGNPSLGIVSVDFGGPMEVGNINLFYETYHDLHVPDTKEKANTLTVYPNPVSNEINLRWKQPVNGVKVSLTNMMGQRVYQTNSELSGSTASLQVDHLPAGTYLLTVLDNSGAVLETNTVVKQ